MKKILKTLSLVVTLLMIFTFIQKDTQAANEFVIDESTKTLTRYDGTATDVVVPDTIENIAANAFLNQTSLVSVQLPASLKTIENSAFEGCSKLKTVEFSGVIENLNTIGDKAFSGCNQLTVNWVIRNGHNINVTAGALKANNHAFLMLSSTVGETMNEISNLEGTYYQAIEETILIDCHRVDMEQAFMQGYIDMSDICNLYEWNIIDDHSEQYDDSLYRQFHVPTDNSQINYRLINDPMMPYEPPILAYIQDNKLYYNGQKPMLYGYASYSGSDKEIEFVIMPNKPKPGSFKIDTPPLKTEYYEGETFDPTGIIVSLVDRYNDTLRIAYTTESEYYYDSLFLFNGQRYDEWGEPLVLSASDTSITVGLACDLYEYGILESDNGTMYFTTTLPITVKSIYATEISVNIPPAKVNYFEGDKFDPTGLVIHVKNNNDTEEDITYGDQTKDKFSFSLDTLQSSDTEVEITYDGQTVKQKINVSPLKVDNVSIKQKPTHIEYYEGDTFDPEGLSLTLTYNNGKTEDIVYSISTKDKFSFSVDKLKESDKEVKIVYGGFELTQSIEVHPLLIESAVIKNEPTQLEYYEEDIFNPSGLIITVKYNSGKVIDIEYSEETKNEFTFSLNELNVGDKEIKIIYQSNEFTLPIIVKERYTKDKVEKDIVEIEGQFEEDAYLVIEEISVKEEGKIFKDKQILGSYEVSVVGKYRGELKLSFEVGTEHNGRTAYILHQKQNGSLEKFEQEVIDGKVMITVHELSPFIIYIDKDKTEVIPDENNDEVTPPIINNEQPPVNNNNNKNQQENNVLPVINEPIIDNNIPTGDDTRVVMYITVSVIGLLGIGYCLFKRKQGE